MKVLQLKGVDKFREKLPAFHGIRIILIPIIAIVLFVIGFSFQLLLYWIPRNFPDNYLLFLLEPILPILGLIILLSSGFFLVSRMWTKRRKLLLQSEELAYQRGFIFGMFGIPLVISTTFHAYLPIEILTRSPINPITPDFSISLLVMIPGLRDFELLIRFLLGPLILIGSILTILQALWTFGLDYMALVYLYYPEESELQNQRIYSVLRHPTYFGLILISLGGFFLQFSIYSISSFFLVLIGFYIHIMLIEEKELIERFGNSFLDYKKTVPAFFFKPRNTILFIKFLLHLE
jgi:protein-S-isoprenylcysteine O-methyltransferase Ste14